MRKLRKNRTQHNILFPPDHGYGWCLYLSTLKKLQSFCITGSSFRETDIENRPMDMGGGEEGEGEMYGESNMEIFNTICKIDNQWEFAV